LEALNSFLMARKLNPSSRNATYGLAYTYAGLKKWHLASELAQQSIRLDPDWSESHLLCAFAHAELGDEKKALKSIQETLDRLPPDDSEMMAEVGMVFASLGKYPKALEYYENALEIQAECVPAMMYKVHLLAACPDPKIRNGALALKLALKLNKQENLSLQRKWQVCMLVAESYAECRKFKEAVQWAKKALEMGGPRFGRREEYRKAILLFEAGKPCRMRSKVTK
jgi:tetratricopeptide (TPR) repeat protein